MSLYRGLCRGFYCASRSGSSIQPVRLRYFARGDCCYSVTTSRNFFKCCWHAQIIASENTLNGVIRKQSCVLTTSTFCSSSPSSRTGVDWKADSDRVQSDNDDTLQHKENSDFARRSETTSTSVQQGDSRLEPSTEDTGGLLTIPPFLPTRSFNLAPYVNDSETLTNLVRLQVDLSKVEEDVDIADFLVKARYKEDINPYLLFLHRVGVQDSDMGECITRFPYIFKESLENLQVRVNYLESKKFTRDSIGRIVAKCPTLLSMPVKKIDGELGALQKLFRLTGGELRLVVTKFPKLTVYSKLSVQILRSTLKDSLEFTEDQIKDMLLVYPRLYISGRHALIKRFNYLHDVIGLKQDDMVLWPQIFRARLQTIQQRHQFLKLIGRDQFDPKKENYVALKHLAVDTDAAFCVDVAKVSVSQYNEFLKTL